MLARDLEMIRSVLRNDSNYQFRTAAPKAEHQDKGQTSDGPFSNGAVTEGDS